MKRLNSFLKVAAFAAALFVGATTSQAQQPTMPANTVYGRLAIPAQGGPPEAIPLPTLGNLLFPYLGANQRVSLKATASYYVNGSSSSTAACGPTGASTCSIGNDGNNCLTPGTACLTTQHVVNIIIQKVDFNGFTAQIYLAHGSSSNYAFTCTEGPVIGQSVFTVQGDTTAPTAVTIIGPVLGPAVQVKDGCTVDLDSLAFADNATNNVTQFIIAGLGNYGHIDISNLTFGSMTIGTQLSATYSGSITAIGPLTITGGANAAVGVSLGGVIDFSGQTVTLIGTPAYATVFAYVNSGGFIGATNSTFSGSATGLKCEIVAGSNGLQGYDPNAVFSGSVNCVDNNWVGPIATVVGTLPVGLPAWTFTATQPVSPTSTQDAILWTITGAGSASFNNVAFAVTYAPGYTGANFTAGLNVANQNAGTGGALSASSGVTGNVGGAYAATATTTGYNFGIEGRAFGGNVNLGSTGIANTAKNSATNIGVMGMGINTGSTPIEVGGWFTLGQTTPPPASAALIADTAAANTLPIALWQVGGVTVASVNSTGGLTGTLTNVASTSAVCYNTSTGLLTYDSTIGTCNTSTIRVKHDIRPLADMSLLDGVLRMKPVSFYYNADQHTNGQQLGLIAEDLAAIDPRLVAYDDKGRPNAIRFLGPMFSYVIGAIKELKADNDNLREDISQLKRATR
jgi:hypothetical protein